MRVYNTRIRPLENVFSPDQYDDTEQDPPKPAEKSRHNRRRRINPNNHNRNINPREGNYWLPTNYAELLYRRKNGNARFQQAVRKKKVLKCLSAIAAAVVVIFILALIIGGLTYFFVAKYRQAVLALMTNGSQIYLSTGESLNF